MFTFKTLLILTIFIPSIILILLTVLIVKHDIKKSESK